MNELLSIISQFSPMATVALALVIIWQLIRATSKVGGKVEKLGSNHIVHLEQSLKDHIDLHERREMEAGRQVLEALGRIERAIIEGNAYERRK